PQCRLGGSAEEPFIYAVLNLNDGLSLHTKRKEVFRRGIAIADPASTPAGYEPTYGLAQPSDLAFCEDRASPPDPHWNAHEETVEQRDQRAKPHLQADHGVRSLSPQIEEISRIEVYESIIEPF